MANKFFKNWDELKSLADAKQDISNFVLIFNNGRTVIVKEVVERHCQRTGSKFLWPHKA